MKKRVFRILLFGSFTAVALVILVCFARAILAGLYADAKETRRQARYLVETLIQNNQGLIAYWVPGRKEIFVSIYEVTDSWQQDEIIAQIQKLKAEGEITCRVTTEFLERENWIEYPENAKGISGRSRGSERLLRTVTIP